MMPACKSDACCQGRNPCPTPDACRLPVPDENRTLEPGDAFALVAIMLTSAALSLSFVAWIVVQLVAMFSE